MKTSLYTRRFPAAPIVVEKVEVVVESVVVPIVAAEKPELLFGCISVPRRTSLYRRVGESVAKTGMKSRSVWNAKKSAMLLGNKEQLESSSVCKTDNSLASSLKRNNSMENMQVDTLEAVSSQQDEANTSSVYITSPPGLDPPSLSSSPVLPAGYVPPSSREELIAYATNLYNQVVLQRENNHFNLVPLFTHISLCEPFRFVDFMYTLEAHISTYQRLKSTWVELSVMEARQLLQIVASQLEEAQRIIDASKAVYQITHTIHASASMTTVPIHTNMETAPHLKKRKAHVLDTSIEDESISLDLYEEPIEKCLTFSQVSSTSTIMLEECSIDSNDNKTNAHTYMSDDHIADDAYIIPNSTFEPDMLELENGEITQPPFQLSYDEVHSSIPKKNVTKKDQDILPSPISVDEPTRSKNTPQVAWFKRIQKYNQTPEDHKSKIHHVNTSNNIMDVEDLHLIHQEDEDPTHPTHYPVPSTTMPTPNQEKYVQLHRKLVIEGYQQHFPTHITPYPIQISYCRELLRALASGKNCALESATGTGKSMSCMVSVIAYLSKHGTFPVPLELNKVIAEQEARRKPGMSPLIIIASRTHVQISQLSKTIENQPKPNHLRVLTLGSKKQQCVHRHKDRHLKDLDKFCEVQREDMSCKPHRNIERFVREATRDSDIYDIPKMVEIGTNTPSCSFYGSKDLLNVANVVICHYNYLLNPVVRKLSGMNHFLPGSIVLIDEAHNIEPVGRQSYSGDFLLEKLLRVCDKQYDCAFNMVYPKEHLALATFLHTLLNGLFVYLTKEDKFKHGLIKDGIDQLKVIEIASIDRDGLDIALKLAGIVMSLHNFKEKKDGDDDDDDDDNDEIPNRMKKKKKKKSSKNKQLDESDEEDFFEDLGDGGSSMQGKKKKSSKKAKTDDSDDDLVDLEEQELRKKRRERQLREKQRMHSFVHSSAEWNFKESHSANNSPFSAMFLKETASLQINNKQPFWVTNILHKIQVENLAEVMDIDTEQTDILFSRQMQEDATWRTTSAEKMNARKRRNKSKNKKSPKIVPFDFKLSVEETTVLSAWCRSLELQCQETWRRKSTKKRTVEEEDSPETAMQDIIITAAMGASDGVNAQAISSTSEEGALKDLYERTFVNAKFYKIIFSYSQTNSNGNTPYKSIAGNTTMQDLPSLNDLDVLLKNVNMQFLCLSAQLAMKEQKKCKCIITTSATLAPFESLSRELNVKFPHTIQLGHVAPKENILVYVLPRYKNVSFTFMSKSIRDEHRLQIGILLGDISRTIYGGIIVFFRSRGFLDECVRVWKREPLWKQLMESRNIFIEPQLEPTQYDKCGKQNTLEPMQFVSYRDLLRKYNLEIPVNTLSYCDVCHYYAEKLKEPTLQTLHNQIDSVFTPGCHNQGQHTSLDQEQQRMCQCNKPNLLFKSPNAHKLIGQRKTAPKSANTQWFKRAKHSDRRFAARMDLKDVLAEYTQTNQESRAIAKDVYRVLHPISRAEMEYILSTECLLRLLPMVDKENTPIPFQNGGIMLGVARGRIGEGMDFPNCDAKAIMSVGIPLQQFNAEIIQKMRFNNSQVNQSGESWYHEDAMNYTNQALGRAVRGISDSASMFILDERFVEEKNKRLISNWILKGVQKSDYGHDIVKQTHEFQQQKFFAEEN